MVAIIIGSGVGIGVGVSVGGGVSDEVDVAVAIGILHEEPSGDLTIPKDLLHGASPSYTI